MLAQKTSGQILMALAIISGSSPALANDEYRYRVTVVNRTGEDVSLICNAGSPRPLALGKTQTLTFLGAETLTVECIGYDHHGEAITSAKADLDHHHLVHTMTLRRGDHH